MKIIKYALPVLLIGAGQMESHAAIPIQTEGVAIAHKDSTWTEAEIANRLAKILYGKLDIKPNELNRNTHFINDLGADSLDTVEIIMEVEKEFDVRIPDEAAEKMARFSDVVDWLVQHTN